MTVEDDAKLLAELVETFKKLREGEERADKMERLLDQLESNIGELFAATEELKKPENAEIQLDRNSN